MLTYWIQEFSMKIYLVAESNCVHKFLEPLIFWHFLLLGYFVMYDILEIIFMHYVNLDTRPILIN
jgi:hypothetical protein